MLLATYIKQPRERKRYDVDYDCWLTVDEDIIEAHAEVFDLSDKLGKKAKGRLRVDDVYIATDKKSLYFYADKGVHGHSYKVTVLVNTSRTQTEEVEIVFNVVDV
jgi:6-pyruvoyl-tetrahydropterin synthase